jgi:hypothetical protein
MSGWVWVALGLAVVSTTVRRTTGGELWGVAASNAILPRTIYTAFSPYLFGLMFQWLSSPSRKLSVVIGACLGLAANLHPTSGLFMVGFAVGLFVLTHRRSWREWSHLVMLLGVTVVGALPIALSVFGNTGQPVPGDVSFETFSHVVIERIQIPFRPPELEFHLDMFEVHLTRPLLDYLVWLYLISSLVLAGLFYLKRDWVRERAGVIWLVGGLTVLAYAFVVAKFNEVLLFAVAGLYVVYRYYRGRIEALDWWSLGVMALVVHFSYVGCYLLAWAWQTFEFWSLTSLLIEQSRAARYVYVPVFFLCVRAAAAWIPELQARVDMQRGLLYWGRTKPEAPPAYSLDASCLALAFGLLFAFGSGISRHMFNTVPGILLGLFGLISATILLAVGLHILQRLVSKRCQVSVALISLTLIVISPLGGWMAAYSPVPVPVLGAAAQAEEREADGSRELYAWAQANTSPDALFYPCGLDDQEAMRFRARSQRSITHNWKDLGFAIYNRAYLVEFYERYRRLQAACQTPDTAIAMAKELRVDYILAPLVMSDAGLPLCFSSGRYAVYAVGQDCNY